MSGNPVSVNIMLQAKKMWKKHTESQRRLLEADRKKHLLEERKKTCCASIRRLERLKGGLNLLAKLSTVADMQIFSVFSS
jgi:hypothetical protein